MILLLVFIILVILIRAMAHFLSKRKQKTIKFVGPRGTGKTKTLNALMGIGNKTVPTLESYKVIHGTTTIYDIAEKEGDFFEKYGIDNPSAVYFFFMKNVDDLDRFPETKDFDVRFVYYGSCSDRKASERKVIVLNEDPSEIEKHFP